MMCVKIKIYMCVFSCFFCTSEGDITVEIEELLDHTQTQNGKERTGRTSV